MTTETTTQHTTVEQVADAGASAGYWTIRDKRVADLHGVVTHVAIESPQGHRFYLSAPNYSSRGTIGIALDTIGERGGLCVSFQDVVKYGTERPTARESYTKTPEVIAKGLNRRIVQNPEVIAACELMAQRYFNLQAQRGALLENLAKVAAMGFEVREPDAKTYYNATAYRYDKASGMGQQVTVSADGRVSFDAVTTVDKLAAVLAAL